MKDNLPDYNLPNIRSLLVAAFSDTRALRRFCEDRGSFSPMLQRVSENASKQDFADALISYCKTHVLFEELLTEVAAVNPAQYPRFEPYRADGAERHDPATVPPATASQQRQAPYQQPSTRWGLLRWILPIAGAVIMIALLVWLGIRVRDLDSHLQEQGAELTASLATSAAQAAEIDQLTSRTAQSDEDLESARATQTAQASSIVQLSATGEAQATTISELNATRQALVSQQASVHATQTAQSSSMVEFEVTNSAPADGRLEMDAIPFTLDHWVWAKLESETGWVYMSLINGPNYTRSYRLDFTLPTTATDYSGAGISFKFPAPEPIDLTEYEFIELDITFESPEVRCQLEMNDITGAEASVLLGMGVPYAQGIDVHSTGNTQTIRIPLEQYSGTVNLKVIEEIGCTVNTDLVQDYHYFQIHQIAFVKK